jgi:DNA-binding NtrC family response regulator
VVEVGRGSGTILVVDDDQLVRAAIGHALADLGYQVIESADGEQALRVFRERRSEIAAILLDMVMPRMNGRTCYQALSEIDRAVRVVLMTGHAMNDEVQSILDLGVCGFLAKPCSIDQLSTALSDALSDATYQQP